MPSTFRSVNSGPKYCNLSCFIFLKVYTSVHIIQQKRKFHTLFMIPPSSFIYVVCGGKKEESLVLVFFGAREQSDGEDFLKTLKDIFLYQD